MFNFKKKKYKYVKNVQIYLVINIPSNYKNGFNDLSKFVLISFKNVLEVKIILVQTVLKLICLTLNLSVFM